MAARHMGGLQAVGVLSGRSKAPDDFDNTHRDHHVNQDEGCLEEQVVAKSGEPANAVTHIQYQKDCR